MDIDGPIRISVLDRPNDGGRELHFTFIDSFQQATLEQQAADFRAYLAELSLGVAELPEDDRDRQGMMLVQQVCEQMLPYIEAGEMALSETIVVALTPEQSNFRVTDLLGGGA